MEEMFILTAYRSMPAEEKELFIRYAQALSEKQGIALQLGEELACRLGCQSPSFPSKPKVELSPHHESIG